MAIKTIFIVCLLLILVSCNGQNVCDGPSTNNLLQEQAECTQVPSNVPQDQEDQAKIEDPVPGETPQEAFYFDASVVMNRFNADQEEKVLAAIEIIKQVIKSQEFRDRVINFTYNGQRQFVDNDGLTNEEVYSKLLEGSETLKPEVDHEMDLDLELYYSSRSTVGYTYPNGLRIWMNSKFFNVYTPAEVAGNIFHEWTHKLGFGHASSYSSSRDSSVPYALGYLVEELGKNYE